MLEIKKITKIYKTEGLKQTALDKVSVNFRKHEFASILGPSGSGKTTFLNIIGGLDEYTSGDLIINNVSTQNEKRGAALFARSTVCRLSHCPYSSKRVVIIT